MSIRVLNRGKPIIGTGGGGTVYADTALDLLCGTNSYTIPSAIDDKMYGLNVPYILAQNSFIRSIDLNNARYLPQSAVQYDTSLLEINAPNITAVSSYCLMQLYSCSFLSFPKLLYVGGSAFSNISALENAYFPKLAFMETWAFQYFGNTKTIDFPELVYCQSNNINAFGSQYGNVSLISSMSFPKLVFMNGGFQNFKCASDFVFELPQCISAPCPTNCPNVVAINNPKNVLANTYANSCIKLISINAPFTTSFGGASYCSLLTDINTPYIHTIANNGFALCSSLSSAKFECAYNINNSAFTSCYKLSEAKLGAVVSIGMSCFFRCSSLNALYLFGVSAPTLGTNVFSYSPILDTSYLGHYGSIYIPNHPAAMSNYATATNWASISARLVLMDSSYNQEYIYGREFENGNIASMGDLSGRENARIIYNRAFFSCNSFAEAIFPSCEIVLSEAFKNCNQISNLSMPNLKYIGDYGFQNCQSISNLVLPNIEMIGSFAFNQCRLSSIDISNVKVIHTQAFYNNSSIAGSINLPNCFYIGNQAFAGCWSITELNAEECLYINNNALQGCLSLSKINIPKVMVIQGSAFDACHIEGNLELNARYIGYGGFKNNSLITGISAPYLVRIDGAAFSGCGSMSYFDAPNVVYLQGGYEFYSCSSLRSVSFPNCFRASDNVFAKCTNLSKIYMPACRNFSGNCFESTAITSFFNNCASFYGQFCFRYCTSLQSVYFLNTFLPSFSAYIFQGTPIQSSSFTGTFGSIYVRASLLSAFQSASYISEYSARMVGLTDEEIAQLNL